VGDSGATAGKRSVKRLLVYTENYGRGGGNRYLVDLVNAVAPDFDQVILCSNPGGIYPEDTARIDVPVVRRVVRVQTEARRYIEGMNKPSGWNSRWLAFASTHDALLFRYNRLLFRVLLARHRPHAVLACNGGYPAARSTLALVVEAGPRVPTAMSVVSTPYPRREGPDNDADRQLDLKIWGAARCIIANARMIGQMLVTRREAPEDLVEVVHNGLPSVDLPERRAHHRTVIGCVARLDPEKGQSTLVSAFAQVAEAHPEADLVFVGDGRERDSLQARIAELGLGDRVRLLGHVESPIEEILAGVDIFAFPSVQEGLPYSILEAMRSGCTIVTTNVGGIPEAIVDGESGLLVPPADVGALAGALDRVLADPVLRERLALMASRRFDACFSLDAMARTARDVLRRRGLSPTTGPGSVRY